MIQKTVMVDDRSRGHKRIVRTPGNIRSSENECIRIVLDLQGKHSKFEL